MVRVGVAPTRLTSILHVMIPGSLLTALKALLRDIVAVFLELKHHKVGVILLTVNREPLLLPRHFPVSSATTPHPHSVYHHATTTPFHHGSPSSHSDLAGHSLLERLVSHLLSPWSRALGHRDDTFPLKHIHACWCVKFCGAGVTGGRESPEVGAGPVCAISLWARRRGGRKGNTYS